MATTAFISSTCYDLSEVRTQLKAYLEDREIVPVLSDNGDVFYNPTIHTHSSCVKAVSEADIMIVIIGGRFGGHAVSDAHNQVDYSKVVLSLHNDSSIEDRMINGSVSITQLEAYKAIETGIPIWTFVFENVWNDHATYTQQKRAFYSKKNNTDKKYVNKSQFASIDGTPCEAQYIFEFIDDIRKKNTGNNIFPFSTSVDVTTTLNKQLSSLLKEHLDTISNLQKKQRCGYLYTEYLSDRRYKYVSQHWKYELGKNKRYRAACIGVRHLECIYGSIEHIDISANPVENLTPFMADTDFNIQILETKYCTNKIELRKPRKKTEGLAFQISFDPPLQKGQEVYIKFSFVIPEYKISEKEELYSVSGTSAIGVARDFEFSLYNISYPIDVFNYELEFTPECCVSALTPEALVGTVIFPDEMNVLNDPMYYISERTSLGGLRMRLTRNKPPLRVKYKLRWQPGTKKDISAYTID